MKYKVGDRVRIKDIDWYNENKNEDGDVELSTSVFLPEMSKYCGTIVTIKDIFYDINDIVLYQMEGGIIWGWTDEMIECLVERNGKTYPYKIGDRVVLKGNNRCATITDLKYNSWGNLSYYIKIDNDKDISIDYPTDLLLPYDDKIKGFLEDETIPKFKVGDKITNGNVTLTILSLLSDRYVVEDTFRKCGTLYFNSQDEWKIAEEEIKSEDEDEKNGESKPKYEDEVNGQYYSTTKYLVRPNGYQFVDENGNVINAMKIVLEKKKKEYPKTYEECKGILEITTPMVRPDYNGDLIVALQKLLICRDAYWKIAGEEMGLGKPWEPDSDTEVYNIYRFRDKIGINCSFCVGNCNILEFPTEEMRDAFKENFDPDIEICKELL